ncbi:MAG: carboxypeptidase-like regulatory domain-containing protein [Gemmatimonadaceae bacterium]
MGKGQRPRWRRAWIMGMIALAGVPQGAASQVVRVTVVDSATAEGIVDAAVAMLDGRGQIVSSGLTRSGGVLQLKPHGTGSYTVFVRRLGFRPTTSEPIGVTGTDTTVAVVWLPRIPQFLPEMAIRAERDAIRNEKFFGMKIGTLGATVISPTQVDRAVTGAKDFTDLVSRNPSAGFGVDYERKCVVSTRGEPPGCMPVIVDGLLIGNTAEVLPPEIVDYIIILRGNEVGVMYGTIGSQGVVLVFTKRGVKRGPQ